MRTFSTTGWKHTFILSFGLLLVTCITSVEAQSTAELFYDPQTGDVVLDGTNAAGGVITNFVLQSNGSFINTNEVENPFSGAFLTANANEVSASDGNAAGLSLIDLGSILQTGLNSNDLESLFTNATYVGEVGSGGPFNFEFVIGSAPEPFLLGDMNGDGQVDNRDIAAFAMALFNRSAYSLMFPGIDPDEVGDFSGDGVMNNRDIAGFAAVLGF